MNPIVSKKVRVRYYAVLRQEAGVAEETVESCGASLLDLWRELREKHRFSLDESLVRAAVDDEFCPWDHPLADVSLVVLMPPVAGG